MPFSFSILKNRSKYTWGVKIALKFLLFTIPIACIFTLIFYQSSVRSTKPAPSGENLSQTLEDAVELTSIQTGEKISAPQEPEKPEKASPKEPQIQKQPNPTQVLNAFDQWIDDFKKISCLPAEKCTDHDPRLLVHFYRKGLALSRTRAKIFEGLIKNDPKVALERSVPQELIQKLPAEIQKNMETWHEGFGDLRSQYNCKGGDHGGCEISSTLVSTGIKFNAHLYGQRKQLTNLNGISYFGVSMGDELAISDEVLRKEGGEDSANREFAFAGRKVSFKSSLEESLFREELVQAERRASRSFSTVKYPYAAGSNGVTNYLTKRYELVSVTPKTWVDAHAEATTKGGRLVCIGSKAENDYINELLANANLGTVSHSWVGLTDNPLQAGSILNKETNTTQSITINASNGDWKWLSGDDVSNGYTNWLNSAEPNSPEYSYASIQISSGKWTEHNETAVLPFIIEYDNGIEPTQNVLPIDGFRKVLIIPARFRDEGFNYDGAGGPKLDNLGNPIFTGLSNDSYEPVSQSELKTAMDEVREFYLRNSDGTFDLNPVIAPTVTLDYDKYSHLRFPDLPPDGFSPQYDSDTSNGGRFYTIENRHDSLDELGENALQKVAAASRDWDFYGEAFRGVADITITSANGLIDGNFSHPPEVVLIGGNNQTNPDPDFVPAKAEAVVNANGQITDIRVIDSGSFYHENNSSITVLLDGNNSYNAQINVVVDRICVSWVVVTTYSRLQEWGLARLGNHGAHVMSPSPSPWYPAKWHPDGRIFDPVYGGMGRPGNPMFASTIAHELGHNFGLRHANFYFSGSERPNSDEGTLTQYANPYSIMGNQAPINAGDLTIPAKVVMKAHAGFGLTIGDHMGVDVGRIDSPTVLQNTDLSVADTNLPANTFRIYRHDHGSGPYPLLEGEYLLHMPNDVSEWLRQISYSTTLLIGGPGEGAEATLDMSYPSPTITIVESGMGYSSQPIISVIDDQGEVILEIDPTWIQVKNGLGENSFQQAQLCNLSEGAHRGLRGLEVNASALSPSLTEFPSDDLSTSIEIPLESYWLSYRRTASEYGLSVINGQPSGAFSLNLYSQAFSPVEKGLLDMTPNTPSDFTDCFLMLGHTFSDYDSDVHITPISKGGNPPMEYLDVVVNIGTSTTASVQPFNINTSTRNPEVGQEVIISVDFATPPATPYSYGWFTNEKMEVDEENNVDTRYEWVNQRMSYNEAKLYAQARGGYLASISSLDEFNEVYAVVSRNVNMRVIPDSFGKVYHGGGDMYVDGTSYFWIGGSDATNEGVWQWESGEPFTFAKWGTKNGFIEPDNFNDGSSDQDGLAVALQPWPFGYPGEWNDLKLTERFTFVIEYPDSKTSQGNQNQYLNKQTITKTFKSPGKHVVRVVVSDLRGGIASKNIVFNVGDYQHVETSSVSGTVFSGHGSIQGARVTFARADVIEHTVSIEGNERDWFLPDGSNFPLAYKIDGQRAPQLNLSRGQIHRFYFDESAEKFGLSFFDQPESEAPRVEIRMKVVPMIDSHGDGYTTVPEVNSTETSLHSSFFSREISTIKEFQDLSDAGITLGQQNEEFLITKPSAKVLLSDTNITNVRIRPRETDDFGNFLVFGGIGHDRNNPPSVTINRESLWEDYNETNATAFAKVDGVGTISAINANNGFLGNRWFVQGAGDPIPEVVVWGSGSEANASVQYSTTQNPTRHHHSINISNQGIDFEPNATMAVLHHPAVPFAMWSFDQQEAMYDNSLVARNLPSPAWNKPLLPNNIIHYWSFDEDNGTVISDAGKNTVDILSTSWGIADLSDANRSVWGVKGRALRLNFTDENDTTAEDVIPDTTFTFSAWLLPDENARIGITGGAATGIRIGPDVNLQSTQPIGAVRQYTFGLAGDRTTANHQWGHIAVVCSDDNRTLFVDGFITPATFNGSAGAGHLEIDSFNGLIDEVYIYDVALTNSQVKELAGRSYFDLSGNKRHLVPVGDDFDMHSPNTMNGSDTDVPTPANPPNNRPNRLGDSFAGENHGNSVSLSGNDYLDLSNHVSEFSSLSEGAISFWIKTADADNIILSGSKSDDNDTSLQVYLNSNGNLEVQLLSDGNEVTKYYAQSPLNDNAWHHVFLRTNATSQNIWIDGQTVGTTGYAGGTGPQPGFLADVQGMDFLGIGKHLDSNTTSFFTGNLDDIYFYNDGNFSTADVRFLFNLNQGRDRIPRLEALVDAVGTVTLLSSGNGYKEQPTAIFSFGLDGNTTTDLINADKNVSTFNDLDATDDPSRHGQLRYVMDENQVYSYNFSTSIAGWRSGAATSNGWRPYQLAVGIPELNATQVDSVLWTKELDTVTQIRLPDDRNVTRKNVEYVEFNGSHVIPTRGVFGYTTPPVLSLDSSPTDQNATAYALFFIDPTSDDSTHITNPGQGLLDDAFTQDHVRITGKGFQPQQTIQKRLTDTFGNPRTTTVIINEEEDYENLRIPVDLFAFGAFNFQLATDLTNNGTYSYTNSRFRPRGRLVGTQLVPITDSRIVNGQSVFVFDDPIATVAPWVGRDVLMEPWKPHGIELIGIDQLPTTTGPQLTIFDTIIGNSSTRFSQEVRQGDRIGLKGAFMRNNYEVVDVVDDQTIIIRYVNGFFFPEVGQGGFDFLDLQAWDADADGILEGINILTAVSQQNSDNNPISVNHTFIDFFTTENEQPQVDDNNLDFNRTLSEVEVLDSGFGYLMPLEIFSLGGTPTLAATSAWVSANNLVKNYQPATFELAPNVTDSNGSIAEGNNSIIVVDGGYGYYASPQIIITGGGGNGAEANATLGERFILTIGNDVLNIGLLNPNLLRRPTAANLPARSVSSSRVFFEQNDTIAPLQCQIVLNETNATHDGNVTIRFQTGTTVNQLITELNATANLFDPLVPGGGATLILGDGMSILDDMNGTSHDSLHSIRHVTVNSGGRGYRNLVSGNVPEAKLVTDTPLFGRERNATLEVKLGGSLSAIETCQECEEGIRLESLPSTSLFSAHDHIHPWVEIWDRGRPESNIRERATAVPKIKDGRIEKVIVVNPGNGYIDPIARIHGASPKGFWYYNTTVNNTDFYDGRTWRCTNLRENRDGLFEQCNHTQIGEYPPERCPGEEDFSGNLQGWQTGHTNAQLRSLALHPNCNGTTHFNVSFKTTVCGGRKANFVLMNDLYRAPTANWEVWDAELIVSTDQGEIQEIRVANGGEMYIAGELAVAGSGGGVEPILVIDEFGLNRRIIFDDPALTNLSRDTITNPKGAGMGFVERPWSWDSNHLPTFGVPERAFVYTGSYDYLMDGMYGDEAQTGAGYDWQYGDATIDSGQYGDRVESIEISDFGEFNVSRTDFHAIIDYNGAAISGFEPAQLGVTSTFRLTRMRIVGDATYLDQSSNNAANHRIRSLYTETPKLNIIDPGGQNIQIVEQNASTFIYGNGNSNYRISTEGNYIDLYIDDRMPNEFYYGFGRGDTYLPAMGGKIKISEAVPGSTWGRQEPFERNASVYTDQNGYYMMPDLEPGMYNVAVFLEDKFFQESTFRPVSSPRLVSQVLYVPGMPKLHLVADNFAQGKCKLEWSVESRMHSVPLAPLSFEQRQELARKSLERIGVGFNPNQEPELIILPDNSNTGNGVPNVQALANIDGSLNLTIIDDINSSTFNPGDRFTVFYSSSISGFDFIEDYPYSMSASSAWGGSLSAPQKGSARLKITPGDGNGTNAVEIPLSTAFNRHDGNSSQTFEARVFDANGFDNNADLSQVQWTVLLDFNNSLEANQTRIVELNQTAGQSVDMSLFSTMRSGRIIDFEIINQGGGYTDGANILVGGEGSGFLGKISTNSDGNVTGITIENYGTGYRGGEAVEIEDTIGSGAVLRTVLGGKFYLEATLINAGVILQDRVRLEPSQYNRLTDRERWLDYYFDTFFPQTDAWWTSNAFDNDGDDLNNHQEFLQWTNPENNDTDSDGLFDSNESILGTNPLIKDTDGDGLLDGNETVGQTNPLLVDTDGDGFTDFEELANPLLNPNRIDYMASVSGAIYSQATYQGNFYLRVEQGSISASGEPEDFYSNNEPYILKTNNFPQTYRFTDLLAGLYYRVSGFIDSNGNGAFDPGEVYAEWKGILSRNKTDAHLVLKDIPPTLDFFDGYGDEIEVARGETFTIAVSAFDFPDDNWSSPLLINTPLIARSISVSGDALNVLQIDASTRVATVSSSADFGNYNLTFLAKDASNTVSLPSTRVVTVTDKSDPVISVNFNPYIWPLGTTWDIDSLAGSGAFSAFDAPSQDLTDRVQILGNVDVQTQGDYTLFLSVMDDFGKSVSTNLTVEVQDQQPPTIQFSTGVNNIDWFVGTPFQVPIGFVSAFDNVDGNVTSSIVFTNLSEIDENLEGNQTLSIEASDSNGNVAVDEITISFQYPYYSIQGVAIDGYLTGASVIFKPASPLLSGSVFQGFTDTEGRFKFDFLAEEFELIDTNQNDQIDPDEGVIEVSGGIDSVTSRMFDGALKADAASSVVTPLTTIVAEMMNQGSTKENAMSALASSFGLPQSIDITNYDPIANAGEGKSEAVTILQSGAVIANIFKQTKQLALASNVNESQGSASMALAKTIASMISNEGLILIDLVEDEVLQKIATETIENLNPNVGLESEELDGFTKLLVSSNKVLTDQSLLTLNSKKMLKTLAQRQIAIEEEIIVKMQDVAKGKSSFSNLNQITTESMLLEVASLQVGVNQFVPKGDSQNLRIVYLDYNTGDVLTQLQFSDGDDDPVFASIIEGNLDKDGDTNMPFSLDSSSRLKISDMDDIKQLAGQTVILKIKLDDNGDNVGLHGQLLIEIKLVHSENETTTDGTDAAPIYDDPSTLEDTFAENLKILQGIKKEGTPWYESPWFGTFYPGKSGWIYHLTLGWLYIHSSENENGFWAWDPHYKSWWWSSKTDGVFPYFYLYNITENTYGWGIFENLDSSTRVFEYFTQKWKIR